MRLLLVEDDSALAQGLINVPTNDLNWQKE